jgi:hypothetical protein
MPPVMLRNRWACQKKFVADVETRNSFFTRALIAVALSLSAEHLLLAILRSIMLGFKLPEGAWKCVDDLPTVLFHTSSGARKLIPLLSLSADAKLAPLPTRSIERNVPAARQLTRPPNQRATLLSPPLRHPHSSKWHLCSRRLRWRNQALLHRHPHLVSSSYRKVHGSKWLFFADNFGKGVHRCLKTHACSPADATRVLPQTRCFEKSVPVVRL